MLAKRRSGALAAALFALAIPTSASAATPIGQTFTPNTGCGASTFLQTVSPGAQYAASSAGVITSWSYQAPAAPPPQVKFKVGRSVGSDVFTIVGDAGPESPAASALNTYPARIAVEVGDVIGLYLSASVQCVTTSMATGYSTQFKGLTDVPPGTTTTFSPPGPNNRLDVAAVLEPDADGDGFGDETQDQCPGVAGPEAGCPAPDTTAPDTTITAGPKDKTRKKSATFEFTGTDARAVASFECSLDGGTFTTCTSPHTVKVKKGRHTFGVRAVDQAGNVGTPATDTWKRKKKK